MASVGFIPIRDGKGKLIIVIHHHIPALQPWLFLKLFALLLINAFNHIRLVGIIINVENFIDLHSILLLLLEESFLLAANGKRQADINNVYDHKVQE